MRICKSCLNNKEDNKFSKNRSVCRNCVNLKLKQKRHNSGVSKRYIGELKVNLCGRRFGQLMVMAPSSKKGKKGRSYWICRCDCGKNKTISGAKLCKNGTTSCGCRLNRSGPNSPEWKGYKEISLTVFNAILKSCSARRRGKALDFNLDMKFLWDLFLKQNRKCALTGLELSFKKSNKTASLDRIDSDKGYIKDNVQWVHKDINKMKNTFSQQYFIEMCGLIYKNCGWSKCG